MVSRSIRNISHLSSAEIDALIQQTRANDNLIYWIDGDLLRELRPDLILTQELCEVCAIGTGSVFETASKVLDHQPTILTVRPAGLEDILQNILAICRAAQVPEQAEALVQEMRQLVERVKAGVANVPRRPRVLCIDWLNPLRNTGQWVPTLVGLAGGREGLATKGGKSREVKWAEVLAYRPEYLMVMPCALYLGRTAEEAQERLPSSPAGAPWRQYGPTRCTCLMAGYPAATVPG